MSFVGQNKLAKVMYVSSYQFWQFPYISSVEFVRTTEPHACSSGQSVAVINPLISVYFNCEPLRVGTTLGTERQLK
jgi:hypothetical protein